MTITRVGPTKKYSTNWDQAFAAKPASGSKKAAAKKTSPKKKSAAKAKK